MLPELLHCMIYAKFGVCSVHCRRTGVYLFFLHIFILSGVLVAYKVVALVKSCLVTHSYARASTTVPQQLALEAASPRANILHGYDETNITARR